MKKIKGKKMENAVITVLREGELTWNKLVEMCGGTEDQWKKIFSYGCWMGGITASDIRVFYYSTDTQYVRTVGNIVSIEAAIRLMRNHLDINYLREIADNISNKKNYMWNQIFANNKKFFSNPVIFKEFGHFLGEYEDQYWKEFIK